MIFNMSGGGGGDAKLNFEVVGGTSAPASPKENTIWVNTSTTITSWVFSSNNPYIGYQDVNLMDGMTLGNGFFSTSGSVSSQTATHMEVYTNEYIPVKYGTSYTWEYSLSTSQSMWLNIIEYTGNYTFNKQLLPVSYINGTYQTGTYTPSTSSVTAVRLSWSTFSDAACEVKFIEPDVMYTIEELEVGTVWISTGVSSPVEFNALKKNDIQVYPLNAKQYINNSWVDKTVLSYQNNKWAEWATYLYNTGDKCIDITGDWTAAGWKWRNTTGGNGGTLAPTITWNNDHFVYNGTGNHASYTRGGCLLTTNDIDLSNVKTISFHVLSSTATRANSGNNTFLYIGVFKRGATAFENTDARIATIQLDTQSQEAWYNIDVSSIDVSYAVGIAASSQAKDVIELKIDKILCYFDEVA